MGKLRSWLHRGLRLCTARSGPTSLPGTHTLADVVNVPQTAVQTGYACHGGCADPLAPRSERCPVVDCDANVSCWQYEESRHVCEPVGGAAC